MLSAFCPAPMYGSNGNGPDHECLIETNHNDVTEKRPSAAFFFLHCAIEPQSHCLILCL